ncbi:MULTISPECIES: hypothetical protein [Rhizobium/Agrobacterium group]|uniref:hypothetical protein n=1 Tax=Rhizobium oryzihabitans TaxID=2267833 RepID=UPI0040344B0E
MADLLAARARLMFEEWRASKLTKSDCDKEPTITELDLERVAMLGEIKGQLEAVAFFLRQPVAPITLEEQRNLSGIRDLVEISQNLEAKKNGERHSSLIVDNADSLRDKAVAKLLASEAPPTVVVPEPSPTAVAPVSPTDQQFVRVSHALPTLEPEGSYQEDEEALNAAVALPLMPTAPPVELAVGTELAIPLPAEMNSRASEGYQVYDLQEEIQYDENGVAIPGFLLDRRCIRRAPSKVPLFSMVSDQYLKSRIEANGGKEDRDIRTARIRLKLFIELIGDHPTDRYTGVDLQAFVYRMAHWPAAVKERKRGESAFDILEDAKARQPTPIAKNTLQDGYVAIVKSALRSGMTSWSYKDPFVGLTLRYSKAHRASRPSVPLSSQQLSSVFRTGVQSGYLDSALLPLLAYLTGRRIGLLTFLKGSDIREKYENVWVAQTDEIVEIDDVWQRVPVKTEESLKFFVLHDFFREIGFIEWARRQGNNFLFPELTRLADPAKSASSYMQRLFEKAGIEKGNREVFHSLRGGNIEEMRSNKIDDRARLMQAGHALGHDEHSRYGFAAVGEDHAFEIAFAPLRAKVDFSVFKSMDFDRLSRNRRQKGHKVPVVAKKSSRPRKPKSAAG